MPEGASFQWPDVPATSACRVTREHADLQEQLNNAVRVVTEKLKSQQRLHQIPLDSLREERAACLAEQLGNRRGRQQRHAPASFTGQSASHSSDIGSESSWVQVCLSCGNSEARLVDSTTSGISVDTSEACFLLDSVFKTESGAWLPGRLLRKGSRVLAADGSILEVAVDPQDHEARATVLLRADGADGVDGAEVEVTMDHRICLANGRTAPHAQTRHIILPFLESLSRANSA